MTESMTKNSLSVVVPVYNSEGSLRELVARLEPVLSEVSNEFEVILINDGSRDKSWTIIEELSSKYNWVHGINLMRNYGQHNALLCGIRAAKHEITITLDDDLQNPPEEIPRLLAELAKGFDVIYGTPEKEQHGLFRDLASQITKLVLQKAMGATTARHVGAFRAFRTRLREAFANYQSSYVSIDVLLTWGTSCFAAVVVHHDPRMIGKSNYNFIKLFQHTMNLMTGFSTLPLRLASIIGFSFTLLGVLLLLFISGRFIIQGQTVPGFPFLASIIVIFSGAQLFTLGIMGEYLARLYYRAIDRPPYVIQTSLQKEE